MTNQLKMLVFSTALAIALTLLGFLLDGRMGASFGVVLAGTLIFFVYWFSDQIILSKHHAREVRFSDSFGLFEMVERLSERARIQTPRIFVVPDQSPNSFATGRNPQNAAVVVTQGLLGLLSYEELEGVLAHEIAHIKNRDTLLGCMVAVFAGSTLALANMSRWGGLFGVVSSHSKNKKKPSSVSIFLTSIFAPMAAAIIRGTVSPSRELIADQQGAELCGQPEWLASALRKVHNMTSGAPLADGGPSTAHLYIINPFSSGAILNLFGTHPPVEERVQRLLHLRYGKYRSPQSGVSPYVES